MEGAINKMTSAICGILDDCEPSIYLYGSAAMDDFRLGWSDVDLLVLTAREMSEVQAERLVGLRQELLRGEPQNPYYRSFEGGMLSLDAFLSGRSERVVYWGTSGERVTDRFRFDSFCMVELLECGRLLCGDELRDRMTAPSFRELRRDVVRHYESIREHAQTTDSSLYSYGWLLDVARCIYTLRTGRIASKTAAGRWALENRVCPVPEALEAALRVRSDPLRYREDDAAMEYAEALGPSVQLFADVLQLELDY